MVWLKLEWLMWSANRWRRKALRAERQAENARDIAISRYTDARNAARMIVDDAIVSRDIEIARLPKLDRRIIEANTFKGSA